MNPNIDESGTFGNTKASSTLISMIKELGDDKIRKTVFKMLRHAFDDFTKLSKIPEDESGFVYKLTTLVRNNYLSKIDRLDIPDHIKTYTKNVLFVKYRKSLQKQPLKPITLRSKGEYLAVRGRNQ